MSKNDLNKLVRPLVRGLHAYVPGEQPKIPGLVKLNTNENPFPPSPRVLAAVKKAVDGRLRLYPNPTAQLLREKLAKFHRCRPENIIVGNGSDELLALATRAFVEPAAAFASAPVTERIYAALSRMQPRHTIQYFTPSYSLYPVLAEIHGARINAVALDSDFGMPPGDAATRPRNWMRCAARNAVSSSSTKPTWISPPKTRSSSR
jgi:histidinol-phosphate aminotransferase